MENLALDDEDEDVEVDEDVDVEDDEFYDDVEDDEDQALAIDDDEIDLALDAEAKDDVAAKRWRPGRVLRVEQPAGPLSPFRPAVSALAALVALYAMLALAVTLAPDRARAFLSHLPFVGSTFAQERTLARNIALRNVRGGYQRLRNARRVFVISGDAVNNSAAAIERIEIEGALYDLRGEVEQKVVNAGNRTSLKDLSEAEIAFLQGLDPGTALAPGQSTPFLIVFLEPPRDLREFSSRVLNVRPTRRASTPGPRVPSRPWVG